MIVFSIRDPRRSFRGLTRLNELNRYDSIVMLRCEMDTVNKANLRALLKCRLLEAAASDANARLHIDEEMVYLY